jgi:hypothetical protein
LTRTQTATAARPLNARDHGEGGVAPRFALGWAALAYALATLSLAYPILAGRFLASPNSDQYLAGYAFREFAATTLKTAGHIPLWNPYLMGGVPYVAGMAGDIFYPPSLLLRAIVPVDVAMSLAFALHLFFAGLFAYLFLRSWRIGFYAALIGGLAYMLSGFVASLAGAGHDGKLYIAALLPLVLWLVTLGVRDGFRWVWGVLALAIGFAVLSPHPQVLQYMLLACGAFALYVAIAEVKGKRIERNAAIGRLALAAGAVVLGFLMGAIQFLPVLEYTPWSPRAGGQGYDYAITYSFPPEELINTYLPQFSGLLDAYWGRNGIHFHSEYIGVVVLMLAGAGLGAVKTRGFARFWLGAFVIALLWSLGGFTPFYHLVYALVPGSKFFRAPSTFFYIVSFCVAVFAAFGVERIAAAEIGPRYLIGWLVAGVLIAVVAAAGGFTNIGEAIADPSRVEAVAANAPAVTLGALRSLLFVVLAAVVMMAFLRGKITLPVSAVALLVLAAVDLWTINRHYWGSSPPAKVVYAPNEITEYISKANAAEQGRVFTLPAQTENMVAHDPFLSGDALMVNDIRMVMGYHGNELGRYQLLDGFAQRQVVQRVIGTRNFARLTNMKYILTDLDSLGIPGYQRLVGPTKDTEGSTLFLFGVPGDNPPAWVTPVIVKAPDEAVFAAVLDDRFDPATAAIFDTSAKVNAVEVKQLPAPLDVRASVTRYEPGHITVRLDKPAPTGAALMVSENYYPGWSATVDGKPAAIGRADFTLIGVELPAGGREIDLTYGSATYERGRAITVVALLLAVVALVAGIVLERRRLARG